MTLALELGIVTEVIVYLGLGIFATLLAIEAKTKGDVFKGRLLNIISLLIVIVYVFDLVLALATAHVIFNNETFTIGTLLCPFIIITRFIKPFDKYKGSVALLCIASLFTYSIYYVRPNDFITLDAFKIFEIYIYYSLIFIYGVVSIASRDCRLEFKKCYREAICLIFIELFSVSLRWMVSYDMTNSRWSYSTKDILIEAGGFILVTFIFCLIIYLIDYILQKRRVVRL